MLEHEGRSRALLRPDPEKAERRRWERPDTARSASLPSPDAIVPELEAVDAATALDDFLALPPAGTS